MKDRIEELIRKYEEVISLAQISMENEEAETMKSIHKIRINDAKMFIVDLNSVLSRG
jgi:hypothetical protein